MKKHNYKTLIFTMLLSVAIILSAQIVFAQSSVNLGTAENFVILSKSGISTTGTTSIVGDIGVSPIDSTAITGFGLIMDSSNQFSTSSLVTGKIYAADYTTPTDTIMTTAIGDMQTAYTDAAGRTLPDYTELGAGDISGMTLTPGLYKWGTGVLINSRVTLNCQGNSNSVFIFQIAQDLTLGDGAVIILSNGCQAKNIFWQIAGQATLGTTSVFNGNILSQTLIKINTGATLNGRALAQTAVTLDANSITIPQLPSSDSIIISSVNKINDIHVVTGTGLLQIGLPKNVSVILSNGTTQLVQINAWTTGTPTLYDSNVSGIYPFAGYLTSPAGITNPTMIMASINVIVSAIPILTNITFSLTSSNLGIGSTQQLNATGFDQFGLPMVANISYTSSDPSIATVNITTGLVTALSSGSVNITAASGTVNRTIVMAVMTVETVASTATSSGGSGGGGSYCVTPWECTDWSICTNGQQSRTCSYPANWCTPTTERPIGFQTCTQTQTTQVTNQSINLTNSEATSSTGSGITGAVIGRGMGTASKVGIILLFGLLIAGAVVLLVRKYK